MIDDGMPVGDPKDRQITALRSEVEDLGNRLHHVHRLWANNEHALRAENERLRKDLSMSVFSDSEYCKVLEGEQERLLKSRNRWAQKYNNLLNKKRAEDGYDVYAAAREEYRKKIAEQAAENERLRAALRYALEEGTSTQYWGDDDDCGTHSCCGEVSYKDHAPDCWTVKTRAALEEKQ